MGSSQVLRTILFLCRENSSAGTISEDSFKYCRHFALYNEHRATLLNDLVVIGCWVDTNCFFFFEQTKRKD